MRKQVLEKFIKQYRQRFKNNKSTLGCIKVLGKDKKIG